MEKEKSQRIQLIYGYVVCVVTVIAFLIAITSLVSSIIDLTDPLSSYREYGKETASLASFENYKVDIYKSLDPAHGLIMDEATFKSMYESARNEAISKVLHQSYRTIIVNSIILLICIILFITHWIWMSKISKKTE